MKFAGWYGIAVGSLMFLQWGFFLLSGQVPELQSEPLRITFHLVAEFITAVGLLTGGVGLLIGRSWAVPVYLVAAGLLLYSVVVSPGYFAQQGQWVIVGMFGLLLLLAVWSIVGVVRSSRA